MSKLLVDSRWLAALVVAVTLASTPLARADEAPEADKVEATTEVAEESAKQTLAEEAKEAIAEEASPTEETPAEEPVAEAAPPEPVVEAAAPPTEESAAEETPATETSEGESAAEEEEEAAVPLTAEDMAYSLDNIVLFVSAILVLFMQAGFAMLEVGLNAAKNTVNILFKNIMDLAVGVLLFYVVGYGLMYPGAEYKGEWFGFAGVGVSEESPEAIEAGALIPQVDFLFQVAFAATAATIVSGAVAGRMKFSAYLVYSAILTGLIYPISGMWKWGGGWLTVIGPNPEALGGFQDFAGSIVVHAVGGFAGLAGAIVLGPRIGRFVNGKSHPMPGHNLCFAALGVFILWVGWYGFNPGSQLTFSGADNIKATMLIALNTTLAPAAGTVIAMLLAWVLFKKPDLTMALNGALAGLVGITANCDRVTNVEAIIIGGIAGALVVGGIMLLDLLRIDDPVGAFPVHGLCGVWGGIATGIFGTDTTLWVQCVGTLAICAWAFSTMLVVFVALRLCGMLRVSAEEELEGLDISEHGMHAYPPHMVTDYFGGGSPTSPGYAATASPVSAPVTATTPSTEGA